MKGKRVNAYGGTKGMNSLGVTSPYLAYSYDDLEACVGESQG